MTRYIDFSVFEAIDTNRFRTRSPYPWANPEQLLTPEGYEALRTNMPDLSLFQQRFGQEKRAGQAPHDRH